MSNEQIKKKSTLRSFFKFLGTGIIIGLIIGVSIRGFMSRMGWGIVIGVCIGVIVGWFVGRKKK
jgi:hypothetical protein